MSITPALDMPAPKVEVITTQGRGLNAEELAHMCVNKIVGIASTAPEPIRLQAQAYKDAIEKVIAHYMKQAIASDRTTVYNILRDAGHPDLAELIRRL